MTGNNDEVRTTVETEPGGRSALTLSNLIGVLRKHWISLIATMVIVVAGAVVWTLMSPVRYSSTTQLFATYNDSSESTNSAEQNSGSSYIMNQIKSYPTLTKTQAVLQPVIDELHLDMSVAQLSSEMTVANPVNTAFINITVNDSDAKQAAAIANATAVSLSKVVENSLYAGQTQSPVKLSVVQPAAIPQSQSSPNIKLNVAIGIIAGIIIGVIVALLRDVLAKTVQEDDDITEYVNAPIIGRITEDEILNNDASAVIAEPGSPVAEDFRRIRTNLSFMSPTNDKGSRLIVITSTGPSEGKTTLSANVATTLCENGANVLLIDADLRHPSIAGKLDLDGSAGLAHVLSGQASVKDVVQRYWRPNLHVMPAGPKPPNASTLLNSPIMSELIDRAMEQYDYVIIDTAPMIVANDAVIFARKGGSVIMVCKRGQTLKRDLREIADEMRTLDLPVSGVIFNFAKENRKSINDSNYYYYSSGTEKKNRRRMIARR